jgi:hypothetical protein
MKNKYGHFLVGLRRVELFTPKKYSLNEVKDDR